MRMKVDHGRYLHTCMSGIAPEAPAGIARQGVIRNTAYGFAFQVLGAVLAAITTVFLARALGPGDFGTYALAMSAGALLALPADLGISPSAQRFAAEHTHDRRAVAAVLGDAFRLKLAIATPVAIALALAAGPIADAFDNPDLAWPLRAAALALFFESFTMLSTGAFVALGRVIYNVRLLPLSLVALVLTVVLVLEGGGATAAVVARAVGLALTAVAGGWLLWHLVGRPETRLRGGSRTWRRRIAGYAGPVVLVDSAFAVFSQLDVSLIGALLGSLEAGLFLAALRIVTFLHYPGYALASAVAPRLAALDRDPAAGRAFTSGPPPGDPRAVRPGRRARPVGGTDHLAACSAPTMRIRPTSCGRSRRSSCCPASPRSSASAPTTSARHGAGCRSRSRRSRSTSWSISR